MKESPKPEEPTEFHLPDTHRRIVESRFEAQDSMADPEEIRQVIKDSERELEALRTRRREAEAELEDIYRQIADPTDDFSPGVGQLGVARLEVVRAREDEAVLEDAIIRTREVLADLVRQNEELIESCDRRIRRLREIDAALGRRAGVFKGRNPRPQA